MRQKSRCCFQVIARIGGCRKLASWSRLADFFFLARGKCRVLLLFRLSHIHSCKTCTLPPSPLSIFQQSGHGWLSGKWYDMYDAAKLTCCSFDRVDLQSNSIGESFATSTEDLPTTTSSHQRTERNPDVQLLVLGLRLWIVMTPLTLLPGLTTIWFEAASILGRPSAVASLCPTF